MRAVLALITGLGLAVPTMVTASDWPQFRGPTGNGVSDAALPSTWGQDANVRWKIEVPGVAWSAPIVSGDKVFVTTAITENQQKPVSNGGRGGGPGGPGGGGPGGPGRRGPGGGPGRGGQPRFSPPRAGEILPGFFQGMLNLTESQQQALGDLQKQVDDGVAKLLTEEQHQEFQDSTGGGRRFRMPTPGEVIPAARHDELKLSGDQKEQLAALQKGVDAKLAELLTDEQNKQISDMRSGRGRGGPGGPGGPGGFGNRRPPDDIYRWELHCLDRATGKTLWSQTALESKPRIPIERSNTYATETPVTDGERVYAYFGMHGVYCYDFAGNLIWKKDLGAFPMSGGWGTASSPVLDGKRLFVLCDNEQESFLVALDALTGDELWRVARSESTSYASPFVWRNKLRTEIIALGSPKVRSYDPATGKQLWELTIGNGRCTASPVGNAEMLFVGLDAGGGGPMGRGQRGEDAGGEDSASGMFAVSAGATGDLDNRDGEAAAGGVVWNSRQNGPTTASPLLYDGYIYIVKRDGGILTCLDAETGEQVYRKRIPGAKAFWSSPWAAEGKVYFADDAGTTFVIRSGPEFEVLGQNEIDEMVWASPAAADGAIFLRSVDHLYCIGE